MVGKLSAEQETELCQRYKAGEPAARLGPEYGVSVGWVSQILRRHDLEPRTRSETNRRYQCDHAFFDRVDAEEKAYWLGFIGADGYVSKSNSHGSRELKVALGEQDEEHLCRLKKGLRSNHSIRRYVQQGNPYVSFSVRSEQLAEGLARFGVVAGKCHTLEWPDLPEGLKRHFLRGYFDGDGYWNIKHGYRNGQKMLHWQPDIAFRLTSDQRFLRGCREYLERTCNLNRTTLSHRHWKGKYSASTLIYSGRDNVSRIFRLMYDGATVYLPRKYERVAPYIQGEPRFLVNLRTLRTSQALTPRQLSEKSGVPVSTIGTLERLHHRARAATYERLARALGETPEVLYSR